MNTSAGLLASIAPECVDEVAVGEIGNMMWIVEAQERVEKMVTV